MSNSLFRLFAMLQMCIYRDILADDPVFLGNESELDEYVLADSGLIWRGSYNRMRPTVWKYSQFERDILDCALHMMIVVGKVRVSGRNDPIVISRILSAAVSFTFHDILKITSLILIFKSNRFSRKDKYMILHLFHSTLFIASVFIIKKVKL